MTVEDVVSQIIKSWGWPQDPYVFAGRLLDALAAAQGREA